MNDDNNRTTPDYRESIANIGFIDDADGKPLPLWSEMLPNLWQGGTQEYDKKRQLAIPMISKTEFDSVYTFYAYANPVDWLVKEYRFGYFDSPDTNFPIDEFKRIVTMAHSDWKRGERVLIRCQAGLNRSSLITALVLIRDGYSPREALDLMRTARHPLVLFNDHFEQWILKQPVDFWRS